MTPWKMLIWCWFIDLTQPKLDSSTWPYYRIFWTPVTLPHPLSASYHFRLQDVWNAEFVCFSSAGLVLGKCDPKLAEPDGVTGKIGAVGGWVNSVPATGTRPRRRAVCLRWQPEQVRVSALAPGVGSAGHRVRVLGHQPLSWMFILSTDLVHVGATVCNSPANFKLGWLQVGDPGSRHGY